MVNKKTVSHVNGQQSLTPPEDRKNGIFSGYFSPSLIEAGKYKRIGA
jgi:hypothetical protein